jgi:hypothetical protein
LAVLLVVAGVMGSRTPDVRAQEAMPLVIPQDCRQDYIWNVCVIKFTDPSGADEEFDFDIALGASDENFSLMDEEYEHFGIESGDIDQFGDVLTIREENLPDGWELVNIWCVLDGVDPSINIDYEIVNNGVEIELVNNGGPSAVILCGFWNEETDDGPDGTPESTPPGGRRPPTLGGGLGGLFGPPPGTATPVPPAAVAPSAVISPPRTGDAGLK